jgi:hypothetical protein
MVHLGTESTSNQSQADTATPMGDATRPLDSPEQILQQCISRSKSRLEFWIEFIQSCGVQHMAEVGVYRGDFAAVMLRRCLGLTRYYMVDPWRHLNDWNKPSNKADSELEAFFQEAKTKTDFAAAKRVILRGKTTEVIDQITDGELDFAYIDADHTLKGIAIDSNRADAGIPVCRIFCGSRRRHHLRAAALAVLSPENEFLTIRFCRSHRPLR